LSDNATRVHPDDNIAVALIELTQGGSVLVDGTSIVITSDVNSGHKIALIPIPNGDPIVKFGQPIGIATTDIGAGDLVHSHNMETNLSGHVQYEYMPASNSVADTPTSDHQFMGYKRADGSVGTRNEIWILVTVGCVNRLAQRLASAYDDANFISVDAVHAFPHPFGCSQSSSDKDRTRDLIAALCQHPNAGGVLLVGLGCETNQASEVLRVLPTNRRQRVRHLAAQQEEDEFEAGKALIDELIGIAETDRRESCGLDALAIGVKCGGSDGFSGISANPLVGSVADIPGANICVCWPCRGFFSTTSPTSRCRCW
jgi:altronate hydrolase